MDDPMQAAIDAYDLALTGNERVRVKATHAAIDAYHAALRENVPRLVERVKGVEVEPPAANGGPCDPEILAVALYEMHGLIKEAADALEALVPSTITVED